ncbi:MAG: glycogen synthase GlgA [Thermodesulfobacteriota bacterium]
MAEKITIVHISSEVVPFAKSGGLADVAGSLPVALSKLGQNVAVFMPYHRSVGQGRHKVTEIGCRFPVAVADSQQEASLLQGNLSAKVPVYFIKNDNYFDRDGLYGTPAGDYPDNAARFSFFCRAVLEAIRRLALAPDVIHCHDWQSGLIPLLLKLHYRDNPGLKETGTVFTVHNLAYQGLFDADQLAVTGLPVELFTPAGFEFHGRINFLKAGLIYSDWITTVSQGYAGEIRTAEYGCGLEGVLEERSRNLLGILNGVDYAEWDPASDKFIAANYSREDISGKAECKIDLVDEFGLGYARERPLVGVISRLAQQKGIDLLVEAGDDLVNLDLALVVLGTGEQRYHEILTEMARRYPDRIAVRLAFDNALAHKIEAGCDMFLMPSRYEPCGLNQIYSLKYGTIPIVRATGGLNDTVEQFDPASGRGNGFKFASYDVRQLVDTVKQAVALFEQNRPAWQKLVANAMAGDFSWDRSAGNYLALYRRMLSKG